MRHFLVLGFATSGSSEMGDPIHLGTDRVAAMTEMKTPDERFKRKEVFELARPHRVRHFDHAVVVSDDSSESDDLPEGDELPDLSNAARALATEHKLTDEQLAEIVPSGATGDIVKSDVEDFIDSLEGDE